jgi:hypothetical protein
MVVDGSDHEAHPAAPEGATNVIPFRQRRHIPPGHAEAAASGASTSAARAQTNTPNITPIDPPQKRHLLRPGRPQGGTLTVDPMGGEPCPADPQRRAAASAPAAPTAAQLLMWLQGLRECGVPTVKWNVATLSLDRAITRAARLDAAALISVEGYQLLVVEPLPVVPPAAESSANEVADELRDTLPIFS